MNGGRTNPWLIIVNENGQEKPYVVKLFNETENDNRESICKEVLGNVLAKEFGLGSPNAALISMDYEFEMTINDAAAHAMYENTDQRIKFATEFISPFYEFTVGAFPKSQIRKSIEIDTLFAFDYLIKNSDRGQARPNILLKDDAAFLIDHELAFNIDNHTLTAIIAQKVDSDAYSKHIFYEYLKNSTRATKQNYFNEFVEYLKYFDGSKYLSHLQQLTKEGYITHKSYFVLQYIEEVRQNSRNFVQMLRGLIEKK